MRDDIRGSGWSLIAWAGVTARLQFTSAEPLTSLTIYTGGSVADVDDFTGATAHVGVLSGGNLIATVDLVVPTAIAEVPLRLVVNGAVQTVGSLLPDTAGASTPDNTITLTPGVNEFALTVLGVVEAGGGGGGAPTTADYLVGTAQAGLSAEIVVGPTPGGELGGTWASPTVDTVHSGSSHAAVQAAAEATAAADATAKANAAQAAAVQRANHTGVQAISTVTGLQAALDAEAAARAAADLLLQPLSEKGQANGYPSLDGTGKIPTSQLPALAINDTFVVNSQAAMLALTAQRGDVAVRTDLSKSFILTTDDPTQLANWQELLTPADAVTSVDGRTGAVSLSDLYDALGAAAAAQAFAIQRANHTGAQAISTVTGLQTALDDKAPLASPALTGNPTAPTPSTADSDTTIATTAHVHAVADAKVAESITNGVTGIAPSQDQVFDALALKAPLASPTFTGDVVVPDADAATEAMNRQTSDARYAPKATFPVLIGVALSDETTAITAGTGKAFIHAPFAFTLTAVKAELNTGSSSGAVTVDINEGAGAGTSVLSTKLTIDQSEETSATAATPAVISDSAIADDARISFDIDGAGTGAKGLKVWLYGTRVLA